MPKRWVALVAAFAALGAMPAFAGYVNGSKQYGVKAEVGGKIRNFYLPDTTGKIVALTDYEMKPLKVLYFAGLKSAASDAYWDELKAIDAKFKDAGGQVIVIFSDADATPEKVAAKMKAAGVDFPALVDEKQRVSWRYGVTATPEVMLVDEHRVVRYRGLMDTQFSSGEDAKIPRSHLEAAMTEMTARVAITVPVTKVSGAPIEARVITPAKAVTYADQISRFVQDNCETCHRDGGIGPMQFSDYKTAKMWAPMMKQVILDERMPPWFADPRTDHKWSNDRRLSDETIDNVVWWIDNGTPEGDVAMLPAKRDYAAKEWHADMGEPDVILRLPEQQQIPAQGSIPNRGIMVPTNFTEDKWIQAVEINPDNEAVVHHMSIGVRAPDRSYKLDGSAPGDQPFVMPKGTARMIPAGSNLSFSMHYTVTGKPEVDQSAIGLWFTKEPPTYECLEASTSGSGIRIAPGADNHPINSTYTFKEDSRLLSLMPHMHVRGKSYKYVVEHTDGRRDVVLNVPQYDFNWQLTYWFAEPVMVEKGAKLLGFATYDNSIYNYANPDPTEEARGGSQTWEEMMIGWFTYGPQMTIAERAKAIAEGRLEQDNGTQDLESD